MADKNTTERFLEGEGISQTEAGLLLGVDSSTVSRKLSGARQWRLEEMLRFISVLEPRVGRRLTLDEVFGRRGEPELLDCPVAPAPACTGPDAA